MPDRKTYDVGIIGLGAMGAATAHRLAGRGARVIGFDRLTPPHVLGSSHGKSRIIREAYYEDPVYVPMVQRAYQLWTDLEEESGRTLYRRTGGLMIGPPDGTFVRGALASASTHGLAHEVLPARALRHRFPAFHMPDDWVGVWEPRAGMLDPEGSVGAMIERARSLGAELRMETEVSGYDAAPHGCEVRTAAGERYSVSTLVIAAGPWLSALVKETPCVVERQVVYWFEPSRAKEHFTSDAMPIAICEFEPEKSFYCMPDEGDGFKIGIHHHGRTTTAASVDRSVSEAEVAAIREVMSAYLPGALGPLRGSSVCLYTNMPDTHFLIDWNPSHERVLLVSPCSGHGFKFAPAIGEIAADLVTTGRTAFDLSRFRWRV